MEMQILIQITNQFTKINLKAGPEDRYGISQIVYHREPLPDELSQEARQEMVRTLARWLEVEVPSLATLPDEVSIRLVGLGNDFGYAIDGDKSGRRYRSADEAFAMAVQGRTLRYRECSHGGDPVRRFVRIQ